MVQRCLFPFPVIVTVVFHHGRQHSIICKKVVEYFKRIDCTINIVAKFLKFFTSDDLLLLEVVSLEDNS